MRLMLDELNSPQLLDQLSRQRIDAAFIRPGKQPPPGFAVTPLDDEPLDWMRGRGFVYSRRKVQNAHVSTTRALPLLIVLAGSMTFSVDDFVRLWHCGHFA